MRGIRSVFAVAAGMMLLATACPQADEVTRPDDELLLGYLLPESGTLAFLGPPMISGVRYAVDEINQAGGPRGLPVRLLTADEAGDAAVASEAADRLLGEGIHALVGAAASGMTRAVIDQVTGAGTVQCSPSNTSAEFTEWDDDGLYFRTAPPDVLQGQVLGQIIADDGRERVALLGRGDGYGRGLVDSVEETLRAEGVEIVTRQIYDPDATTFDAEVSAVEGANPDAVVLVTFEEGAQLMQGLVEAGITGDQMYGADGNGSSDFNTRVDPNDPNVLDGMKGTAPSASPGEAGEAFLDAFREANPDLENDLYVPQAYDCVMLIALATVAAGSLDPREIADNIVGLTRGDNGCAGFEECADLLERGETISYTFASGTEEFRDEGEPVNGIYDVWEWSDGEFDSSTEQQRISLHEEE